MISTSEVVGPPVPVLEVTTDKEKLMINEDGSVVNNGGGSKGLETTQVSNSSALSEDIVPASVWKVLVIFLKIVMVLILLLKSLLIIRMMKLQKGLKSLKQDALKRGD